MNGYGNEYKRNRVKTLQSKVDNLYQWFLPRFYTYFFVECY